MPAPKTNKELENLIKIFRNARDRLLDTIINYHGVGTKVYANTVLKQLKKSLQSWKKQLANMLAPLSLLNIENRSMIHMLISKKQPTDETPRSFCTTA